MISRWRRGDCPCNAATHSENTKAELIVHISECAARTVTLDNTPVGTSPLLVIVSAARHSKSNNYALTCPQSKQIFGEPWHVAPHIDQQPLLVLPQYLFTDSIWSLQLKPIYIWEVINCVTCTSKHNEELGLISTFHTCFQQWNLTSKSIFITFFSPSFKATIHAMCSTIL